MCCQNVGPIGREVAQNDEVHRADDVARCCYRPHEPRRCQACSRRRLGGCPPTSRCSRRVRGLELPRFFPVDPFLPSHLATDTALADRGLVFRAPPRGTGPGSHRSKPDKTKSRTRAKGGRHVYHDVPRGDRRYIYCERTGAGGGRSRRIAVPWKRSGLVVRRITGRAGTGKSPVRWLPDQVQVPRRSARSRRAVGSVGRRDPRSGRRHRTQAAAGPATQSRCAGMCVR